LGEVRTSPGTILVAEDDPAIRRLLVWALEDEGLTVEAVSDGADAIRYLLDNHPALLILDVMMPRADGYQVAEALRAARGHATPILVLTAAGDARDAAARIGADSHLTKPFELVELIAQVECLLGRSHLSAVPTGADVRAVAGRDDGQYADAAAGG
jgi:DNA-binding response OmpR family regulator